MRQSSFLSDALQTVENEIQLSRRYCNGAVGCKPRATCLQIPMPYTPQTARPPRPRYCAEKAFPRYAYLPGHGYAHPVRDPGGHSFGAQDDPIPPGDWQYTPQYLWGVDLFNHGYYWEAHEAWEALWQEADRTSDDWRLLKALILLAAAGVKVREGKAASAQRHAERAGTMLDDIDRDEFKTAIGMPVGTLAERARAETRSPISPADTAQPTSVFTFLIEPRRA